MEITRLASIPRDGASKQQRVVDLLVPLLLAELESHIHSLVLV